MPDLVSLLAKLCLVFCDVVYVSSAFSIIGFRTGAEFTGFFPWLALVFMSVVVLSVLLDKGVQFNLYLAVSAAFSVVVGILVQSFLHFPEPSPGRRVFFIVLTVIPVIHGAVAVFHEVKRITLINYFDTMVIACIGCVTAQVMGFNAFGVIIPVLSLTALGFILLTLIVRRLQTPEEAGGAFRKMVGVLVVLGILALVLGTAYLLSSGLEQASARFVNTLIAVAKSIYRFVVRIVVAIFNWLVSLFPDVYGVPPMATDAQYHWVLEETDVEEGNLVITVALAGLFLVGLIAFIVWRFWGVKVKMPGRRKSKRNLKRKSHFMSGLKALFVSMWISVVFEFRYLTGRNTPSGLLVWTQRHIGKRSKGETPKAFLERVSTDETRAMVGVLVKALESRFYGNTPSSLPEGFASDYRHRMKESR